MALGFFNNTCKPEIDDVIFFYFQHRISDDGYSATSINPSRTQSDPGKANLYSSIEWILFSSFSGPGEIQF